jgi:hypothetical protein
MVIVGESGIRAVNVSDPAYLSYRHSHMALWMVRLRLPNVARHHAARAAHFARHAYPGLNEWLPQLCP